jgi:hypothetical protein
MNRAVRDLFASAPADDKVLRDKLEALRRHIRSMLHYASKEGVDQKRRAELIGLLARVHMLNPEQAAALRKKVTF